jgi:hypothetical protein
MNFLGKITQYQDQAGMFTSEIGTIPTLVSTSTEVTYSSNIATKLQRPESEYLGL